MIASYTVRLHLMDVTHLEELCPECWLPAMIQITYALGSELTLFTATICHECGQ